MSRLSRRQTAGNIMPCASAATSMIGVGIMDDDLVIVRQDMQARSGDIVIALLEDEATAKRSISHRTAYG